MRASWYLSAGTMICPVLLSISGLKLAVLRVSIASCLSASGNIMVNARICGVFIDIDAKPKAATTIKMTTIGNTFRTVG